MIILSIYDRLTRKKVKYGAVSFDRFPRKSYSYINGRIQLALYPGTYTFYVDASNRIPAVAPNLKIGRGELIEMNVY